MNLILLARSMTHSRLRQLVSEKKATIIFVYGTARSGSTITQIIFSHLADLAIHEPFTGLLQNRVTHSGVNQLQFDEEIYQAGCNLIADRICQIIKHKNCATILVKEVSSFFDAETWEKWSQIPEKFLFTIRDPHLQYFSRLSQITKLSNSQNSSSPHSLVLEKAAILESLDLSTLKPFWRGTIIDYNQKSWQKFNCHQNQIRTAIKGTDKKMVIIDATILRKDPEYTIYQIMKQLGFQINNADCFSKNLQQQSRDKIVDIRDPNRSTVYKARNSQEIDPLIPGEDISPDDLPISSRKHILQMIFFYLDMLYAPEQVTMPSLTQLDIPVTQSEIWKLDNIQPFIAYAIASFYLHQKTTLKKQVLPLIQRISNSKTQILPTTSTEREKRNSIRFKESFDRVDLYWNSCCNRR